MIHVPAWDNLDSFLYTDDFAVDAVLHMGSTTRAIKGILDEETDVTDSGDAYSAPATIITFTTKLSSLQNATRRDTLVIGSTTYDILGPAEGDGTGMGVLRLALQTPGV